MDPNGRQEVIAAIHELRTLQPDGYFHYSWLDPKLAWLTVSLMMQGGRLVQDRNQKKSS